MGQRIEMFLFKMMNKNNF